MADLDAVKRLLDDMSPEERRLVIAYAKSTLPQHRIEERLMISSDAMLEALDRAGDFTIRMIRGIFAEGAFASDVLPLLAPRWKEIRVSTELSYDFLLTDRATGVAPDLPDESAVRVQVKMQRSEGGEPLRASKVWRTRVKWPDTHFVVELQRSRKGERKGEQTRPYRFNEFDIVAVSLGPSGGRWSDFVYTITRWLLPDPSNADHILLYQPVSPEENDSWTTDFTRAVDWLRSGVERRIEGDIPTATRVRKARRAAAG